MNKQPTNTRDDSRRVKSPTQDDSPASDRRSQAAETIAPCPHCGETTHPDWTLPGGRIVKYCAAYRKFTNQTNQPKNQ